jgi:SpoVK/Ycf46/Vps4 family AAA+-type ATPase
LLHLLADPAQLEPPLLSRFLKIDERIVNFLLDSDELDTQLLPFLSYLVPEAHLEDLLLPERFKQRLCLLLAQHENNTGLVFYFQGPYGLGKQSTAMALCDKAGQGLLIVNGPNLLTIQESAFATAVTRIMREALLQNASLYWQGFDAYLSEENRTRLDVLLGAIASRPRLTFLAGNTAWEPVNALRNKPFVSIPFPRLDYAARQQMWAQSLNGRFPHEATLNIGELANKFRFSGGQIRDAVVTAANLARWRDPEDSTVNMADLYAASRLQSNRNLDALAQKITPHYAWSDIVLPLDQIEQLREICNQVKYKAKVYEEWGFNDKLSLGKGVIALFAGPSGTGKTMAAEIIAGELGLELYKIDLSTVVSKYIGETEKNLSRIFDEAETSNAILFFDEADALFGKRTEVRDAHDRHANIEISYLLQRMEEYEGVVIMTTNLRKNMDDAFMRRMHFAVEFPFPNELYRQRIWRQIWPEATPRQVDLDLRFMAHHFEIAGGNIRNIAVAAAFLAADDGQEIGMFHLIRATQREYQKLGKVVNESEFGNYAGHMRRR